MRKIYEIIKPFLPIIFGSLILLLYLNLLSVNGWPLALGIIAVVMAAYYIGLGIVMIILGDKLPEKLKDILYLVSICFFPVFTFVYYLLLVINGHDGYGPTGWVLSIIMLASSLGVVVLYVLANFLAGSIFKRILKLVAIAFILAMLLFVIFDINGAPIDLGDIVVVSLVIDFIYANMLISAIINLKEVTKSEKPKSEPKSVEEAPSEE
ncbi:MAG: hypothetical protein K6C32_04525 [Bacilli bacterium]|nr:hypothetical protein [Bacilli bacterium]